MESMGALLWHAFYEVKEQLCISLHNSDIQKVSIIAVSFKVKKEFYSFDDD